MALKGIRKYHLLFGGILLIFMSSCSPTMRLTEDEYLLDENYLVLDNKGPNLKKSEMRRVIKQDPNKKILGFLRFHLWVHNIANNGKDSKVRNWMMESVGEPPVVHDSLLAHRTVDQLHIFLIKKGYFDNHVRDSIVLDTNKNRAEVYYKLYPGEPYRIRNLEYRIEDAQIKRILDGAMDEAVIDSGDVFDISKMDEERKRITEYLRYRGYYFFTKDYIRYQVDSAMAGKKVDVALNLAQRKKRLPGQPDSVTELPHLRYNIRKVVVNTDYSPLNSESQTYDTLDYKSDFSFLYYDEMEYDPDILLSTIFIQPGDRYRNKNEDLTYRRLSELRIFKSVSIQFQKANVDTGGNWLDCVIQLSSTKKQSISFESRGTNKGGNLGVAGNITYRNRNVFKGAETFQVDLNGGVESQRVLTEQENTSNGETDVIKEFSLNTVEIGPEVSLNFPRFLIPVNPTRFARSADPNTKFSTSYNFQQRPDYTRSISKLTLSYRWNETDFKKHRIDPVELSSIQIHKSDEFQQRLEDLNDELLLNSYQDHLILSSGYSFTYNNQKRSSQKNVFFYNGDLEFAGNMLRGAMNWADVEPDQSGSYRIFDVRFAQFIRVDNDFRYLRHINDKSSIAYRLIGGVGVPFRNLEVLPFQKSFFGGGANGIRAWKARTLGPGSYADYTLEDHFDKIGDIRLETNLEYRFDLLNVLEAAFFVDAGNIWLLEPDSLRPGGHFETQTFVNEVGVGTGVGLRVNLDFFIIRFDLALQTRDPALPTGERWIFQRKDTYNEKVTEIANQTPGVEPSEVTYGPKWNLNIGIGYPF